MIKWTFKKDIPGVRIAAIYTYQGLFDKNCRYVSYLRIPLPNA